MTRSRQSGNTNGQPDGVRSWFRRFAHNASAAVGSPWAFCIAVLVIVAWAVTGPLFRYSDTWQLLINTGTTIVTFLMVFLIQNTQNRDARAMHLKLDELIRGVRGARTGLVDLEDLSDEELDRLQKEFERLRSGSLDRPEADEATREPEIDNPTPPQRKKLSREMQQYED